MKTKMKILALITMAITGCASVATAQPAMTAGPEYDVLKHDVGSWKAQCKMWMGPGDPVVSEATETNRMLGEFWLVSDFQGTMLGQPFSGHAMLSYDSKTKKYISSWVDSMSPNLMHMSGDYDAATKTMTLSGVATGPDGKAMNHKLVTVYKEDGSRVFTMHGGPQDSDQMAKIMEITYTRIDSDGHDHDHGHEDHSHEDHGH